MMNSLKLKNQESGMTLFIAVTIMGILVFISFAVINVALKASLFASSGRDSQYAFYAADAGIECALYWDFNEKFSTSTDGSPISCAGLSISTSQAITGTSTNSKIGGGGDASPTSIFGFTLNQAGQGSNPVPHCAIVTVTKYYSGANLVTYIKSRGYNTCDLNNPRRVERGLEVTY